MACSGRVVTVVAAVMASWATVRAAVEAEAMVVAMVVEGVATVATVEDLESKLHHRRSQSNQPTLTTRHRSHPL